MFKIFSTYICWMQHLEVSGAVGHMYVIRRLKVNDILRGYTSNYKYGRQNLFMDIKICRAKIQNCPCADHAFLKGELWTPLILHLGARSRWFVRIRLQPLHLWWKNRYRLNKRQCGPQNRSEWYGEKENPSLLPGFETRIFQSVAYSLHLLSYLNLNHN